MLERFKQWISTIIGGVVIIASLVLWIVGKIDVSTLTVALGLGWTYLAAKDTILNGVTAGIIKVNEETKG